MHSRFPEMLLDALPRYAERLDEPITRQSKDVKRGRFRRPKRQLKKKREEVRLRRLEEVLAIGNWLYGAVRLVERNWRSEVLAGKVLYDPTEEALIMAFFRQWYAPHDRFFKEISHFESARVKVAGGADFGRNVTEVERILGGHNPFFDDAANSTRWAGAIDYLRPNPRPVQVDEDGRLFEMTGEQIKMPGLEPADILEALDDFRSGRLVPNA
jgi:hypothetical protein